MGNALVTGADLTETTVSLNESIQQQLLKLIQDEDLKAGNRLPSEYELSRRFGVSRSALRESMRALEGAGYLESRTGSGWYVKQFSFDALATAITYTLPLDLNTLVELSEVRTLLEANLLEAALPTLTADDMVALEAAVDDMELLASTSGFAFAEPDRYFHRKLFSRLNNQVVLNLLDVFWKLQMGLAAQLPEGGNPVEEARKHRRLLNAIRAGDIDLARRWLIGSLEEKSLRLRMAGDTPTDASKSGG